MAKKNGKTKKNTKAIVFITILAIVVIGIFSYLIWTGGELFPKKPGAEFVAKVNGEVITKADLELEYSKLPAQYKAVLTKDDVLKQMVDKKLLLQEASQQGINASVEEIQSQIDVLKTQFPSEQVFEQALSQQNLTLPDIEKQIKEQIEISKLLNASLPIMNISEVDIQEYYAQNKKQFSAETGQVRLGYLLMKTKAEADEILKKIKKGKSFESFEKGNASIVYNMGFFSKGTSYKEIEDVAFKLKVGDISNPIVSSTGVFLIKRLPDTITIDEARNTIAGVIEKSKQTAAIAGYIAGLKAKAVIEYAGNDTNLVPVNINQFIETTDDVCMENGKPIVRLYTSSKCDKCKLIEPVFRRTAEEFNFTVKEWEVDTGDDLFTSEVETNLPKQEFDIFKKYSPKLAVPTFVFGCKYIRIGYAYETLNLVDEETQLRETFKKLQ